jgi:hypothetical protein
MSNPKTSTDTPSATSSQESAGGVSPCNLQNGTQLGLFGQEAAHASRSAVQAKAKEPTMNDTYGLSSPGSSASASLQQSLASKLQARLDVNGSMEYRLTWKTWVTPQQRQICALRASTPRISAKDYFGWPTPNAGPQNDMDTKWQQRRVDCQQRHGNNGFGLTLGMASTTIAGWPTPDANCKRNATSNAKREGKFEARVAFADAAGCAVGWATPTTRDHKDTGDLSKSMVRKDGKPRTDVLGRQTHGVTSISSDALSQLKNPDGTWRKGVGLNPALSRWLMGYPVQWSCCGIKAMKK